MNPRRVGLEALGLALASFLLYAWGACPTIYVGDSGELVTAAATLGIPHPSGYPLYVLLGKLWTLLLPFGSVAYRMSLFSSLCAALAVSLLHWVLRRCGMQTLAAALGAALLATSPSFWGEANVPRVYALNAAFVLLATGLVFTWQRTRRARDLVLACFVCGVGASNHTFMAVQAAAIAACVLVTDPALLRRVRLLAAATAAFLAGLLPYSYLLLRARSHPRLDWGHPATLPALADVVLRRDYWPRAYAQSAADVLPIALDFVHGIGAELGFAGSALALCGVWAGFRRGWPVGLPLLVMLANLLAVGSHGSRADIFIWHRYAIPAYAMGALLAGFGAQALLERLAPRLRWLLLALPCLGVALGWQTFDRSRYRVADDFSRTLLAGLPPGAHLQASDDNILFPLLYLTQVEGLRPDIDLVLSAAGVAEAPLGFEPDRDALFFTHHPNWQQPGLVVVPVGLAFQVVREGAPAPQPVMLAPALAGEHDARVPKDFLTRNLIGHFHFMRGLGLWASDPTAALRELAVAAQSAPEDVVLAYNLGLHYARNGLHAEALAAFSRAQRLAPRPNAIAGEPDAAARIPAVAAEVQRLVEIERQLSGDLERLPPSQRACVLAERLTAAREPLAALGWQVRGGCRR